MVPDTGNAYVNVHTNENRLTDIPVVVYAINILQSILQKLVHACHFG